VAQEVQEAQVVQEMVIQVAEAEKVMKRKSGVLGQGRQCDNVPGRGAEGTGAGSILIVPVDPRGGKSGKEGTGTEGI
jgi:hypothetical protein